MFKIIGNAILEKLFVRFTERSVSLGNESTLKVQTQVLNDFIMYRQIHYLILNALLTLRAVSD